MTAGGAANYRLDASGQVLVAGERFLPFMAPIACLKETPDKAGPRFVAGQLQLAVQRSLQNLLNGDLLYARLRGIARFPWVPVAHLGELLSFIPALNAAFGGTHAARLSTATASIKSRTLIRFDETCALLGEIYQLCRDLTPREATEKTINVRVRDCGTEQYYAKGLQHLIEMRTRVIEADVPALSGLYIQGSLSTFDFTEFSDTDAVLLIDETCLTDPKASSAVLATSLGIGSAIYAFDPFQHHRLLILTHADLDCYSQALLPTEVFQHATVLAGKRELTFNARDSRLDHRTYLWSVLQRLRLQVATGEIASLNSWRAKLAVATVLFVPVLFLQALGTRLYKRDSFAAARHHFGTEAWEAVETASAIRREWTKEVAAPWRLMRWILCQRLSKPLVFERLIASRLGPACEAPIRLRLSKPGWRRSVSALVESAARQLYALEVDEPWRWYQQ